MCLHCCHIIRKLRFWYRACEIVPAQVSVKKSQELKEKHTVFTQIPDIDTYKKLRFFILLRSGIDPCSPQFLKLLPS